MHSVLVYHTIRNADDCEPCDELISPQRFAQQLRWLARTRTVAPLKQTLTTDEKERLVAITFDDGFRDNLTIALPILERFGLPLTLFVVAGFVDREQYLSKEELREMARHPLVTIGSHGLWHRHFNQLSYEEARFELLESRRLIEEIIDEPVDLLAWPFGECNARLERLSAECGYRASWSVWKGTNGAHSRWRVPLGRHDNLLRFIAKSSGLYALTEAKWHRWRWERAQQMMKSPEVPARLAPPTKGRIETVPKEFNRAL